MWSTPFAFIAALEGMNIHLQTILGIFVVLELSLMSIMSFDLWVTNWMKDNISGQIWIHQFMDCIYQLCNCGLLIVHDDGG